MTSWKLTLLFCTSPAEYSFFSVLGSVLAVALLAYQLAILTK